MTRRRGEDPARSHRGRNLRATWFRRARCIARRCHLRAQLQGGVGWGGGGWGAGAGVGERDVRRRDLEACSAVGAQGSVVVAVDVEADRPRTRPREVPDPERRHRSGEPSSLDLRVHRDRVHLALVRPRLPLRPVRRDEPRPITRDVLHQHEPGRVEPRLRLALVQVGQGHPALLGVVGEGRRVELEPCLLVLPDDERPRHQPLGQPHRLPVLGPHGSSHPVQLADDLQPPVRAERPRRREPAVGPEPRPRLVRQHRVDERAPHPTTPRVRVDDELDRPVGRDLPVPDQSATLARHQVARALPVEVEEELLRQRRHPVRRSRPPRELPDLDDRRAQQPPRPLETHGAVSTLASTASGTNRYPTLRTVPMRTSWSCPSLARSRRTWTSIVRVPP